MCQVQNIFHIFMTVLNLEVNEVNLVWDILFVERETSPKRYRALIFIWIDFMSGCKKIHMGSCVLVESL